MRSLILFLAFASAPALAAGPHHRAEPAAAQSEAKFVLKGTLWRCKGQSCIGGEGGSRPEIACALLVRKVGMLRSFSTKGEALSGDKLEKCNAEAR